MSKLIENTTAAAIELVDMGITIPATSTYEIGDLGGDVIELSDDLETNIQSGNIKLIESEGPTVYYSATQASRILRNKLIPILAGGQGYELLCTDSSGAIVWSQGTVIVQEEGVQVGSIPFNTLNFIGPAITATDATGGQTNITIVALQNIVEDITPQLGGQLDVNTFGIGDGTNLLLDFVEDASAVNYIEIENEATGSGPIIRAVGADTDVNLVLVAKGTGNILLSGLTYPNVDGTNGQFLKTDGAGQLSWVASGGGSETLSAVQARRTTVYTLTTSYVDITFDVTDVETDATAIEHNSTNTERIDIKVDGTYTVLYSLPTILDSDPSAQINVFTKVLKNGTTLLAGSDLDVGYHFSGTYSHSEHTPNNRSVTMSLTAGDYLTLQTKYTETAGPITSLVTNGDVIFQVIKLDGVTGPAGTDGSDGADGAPGSGTTLIVKDEGTNVANTPHSAFNFVGPGVTVTDAGAGVADVTISVYGSEFQEASSDTESSTTSSTFQQKLRMTTSSLPSGTYRIAWYYEWRLTTTTNDFKAQVQINDTITLMEHQQEPQDSGDDQYNNHSGFYYSTGSGVLNIDIDYSSGAGTAYIRRARLEIWRVS